MWKLLAIALVLVVPVLCFPVNNQLVIVDKVNGTCDEDQQCPNTHYCYKHAL
jgi:hypothetical protein